jgi:lipopolysaccharide biosynthesis glycosyltransferase
VAVAYVTDANYHEMTLFALASVALVHGVPVDFFLFQHGYEREVPPRFRQAVEGRGHSLTVAPAPAYAPAKQVSIGKHLTSTTYLRVAAIEQLAHEYAYIAYLDGDTLAFGDLHLERIAGFEESVAACLDLSVSTGFDDPAFYRNCSRNGVSPDFFNAGVIVINGAKWLRTRALDRFTRNLFAHSDACAYMSECSPNDQCALNLTFDGDCRTLPVPYNVQKSALHTKAWSRALVRHYTGRVKFMPVRPWRCDRREYALLRRISAETGLALPAGAFDYGFSYFLNAIRRHRTVLRYEAAIGAIENRLATPASRPTPLPQRTMGTHSWH